MIEIRVKEWLQECLPGVPVYVSDEDAKDEQRIVIDRTGGGNIEQHVRTAMLAVQSYGPTKLRAAHLHESVLQAMLRMTELDDISAISVNAEYDYPDYTRKENRFQAVFNIVYYQEA